MLEKRYDPKAVEAGKYDKWKNSGYFTAGDISKKPFSIVIPPPNVTGSLHLGHTLMGAIEDSIIRYKRLKGFISLWVPGTDHAGIATQSVVEKKLIKASLTPFDLTSSIVKKYLLRSKLTPNLVNCSIILSPYFFFQSQTFFTKSSLLKSVLYFPSVFNIFFSTQFQTYLYSF